LNEGTTSKATIIVVTMAVDHQMAVIVVHVEKKMVNDVLLDGKSRVNLITTRLWQKLGLPPPQRTPFNLQMADFSFNKPLEIVPNIRIRIHSIPYIITFTMMNNKVMDLMYSMLLGCPWVHDVKVIHDSKNRTFKFEKSIWG